MINEWDRIDQQIISFFDEREVIRSSNHLLRAGGKASHYFDFDMVANDPHICEIISKKFVHEIKLVSEKEDIDFLAFIFKATGGTVGMLRFGSLLSVTTRLPNAIIRLDKELISERLKLPFIEKVPLTKRLNGMHALIITDHCTTGSEVLAAADVIENHSGKVIAVISLTANSDKICWEKFQKKGIYFHHLFNLIDGKRTEPNYSVFSPLAEKNSEVFVEN